MKVRVKFIVQDRAGEKYVRSMVTPLGMHQAVSLPTPYLLNAGQEYRFSYETEIVSEGNAPRENDARTLPDILTDAIQHGRENPTHGTNCACMDGLLAEIRGQITGILPTFQVESDWEKRIDARSRVAYLLRTATRTL